MGVFVQEYWSQAIRSIQARELAYRLAALRRRFQRSRLHTSVCVVQTHLLRLELLTLMEPSTSFLLGEHPPRQYFSLWDHSIVRCLCSDAVTVLEALPLPYEATHVDQYPPIPTATQPSDHLPLGVDISF
jgi:hypothetical protein